MMLALTFFPCSELTASGVNTYSMTFSGLRNYYSVYLPSSSTPPNAYSNLSNGLTGLKVKPYPVRVSYTISRSSTPSRRKKTKSPYFHIRKCTIDGSITDYYVNTGEGGSGSFDLPANCGMYLYVYTGENKHKYSGDNNGYTWYLTLQYRYDETAPEPPDAPRVKGGSMAGEVWYTKYNEAGKVNLEWDAVADRGTLFSGFASTSGISHYNIYGKEGVLILPGVKPAPGQTIVDAELDGSLFTVGQASGIKIQAVDNEGNVSDFGPVAHIIADNIPPQGPQKPTTSTINNCTNADPVIWTWEPATDSLSGVKQYQVAVIEKETGAIFKRDTVPADTTGYSCPGLVDQKTYQFSVIAEDYAGNLSDPASHTVRIIRTVPRVSLPEYPIKLDNGTLTFTWNPLSIDGLGVKEYEIAVTESREPPAAAQDASTGNSFTKGKYTSRKIWYAWVRAVDVLDNRSDWTMAGPFPGFILTGPEDGLVTNRGSHIVNVQPRHGQELKYNAKYQTGSHIFETGTVGAGELSIKFPFEAEWQWWLEVSEYQNGTEISASKVITEAYTLKLDQTAPTGSLTVTTEDGGRICTEAEPSNQRVVRLTNLRLADESGVKGITLWNGTETTPPGDAVKYGINEIPSDGIPWELPDLDGVHHINMMIEDNAGNRAVITSKAALDRIAPGMPMNITHSYTNGVMTFKWAPGEPSADISHYRGVCLLPDGTEHPFTATPSATKAGQYQIPVEAGANQPVIIKVCAVDRATNESVTVEHRGCTPAEPGQLQFLETGYDTVRNSHYLAWKLVEPGTAASHKIEYGQIVGGEFILKVELSPDLDGIFIHNATGSGAEDKLQPHATYSYRLVAYNQAGDRSAGPVFTQDVENLAPLKPESIRLAPTGYASVNVVFDYPEVKDYDHDAITYTIKWAEGTPSDLGAYRALAPDETGKFVLNLNPARHGETFSWFLEAKDSYGAVTPSDVVEFVLDAHNPELNLEKPQQLYTNLKELMVRVKDDLSGIKSVTYQAGNLEPQPIQLTSGPGGEMLGKIPLTEGRYNLKVTAYDHAGNRVSADVNNLWVDHAPPNLNTDSIKIDLPAKDGVYLTSGKIPVSWQADDSGSGIAGIRYWILGNGETAGQGSEIPLSSGLSEYAHNLTIGADKPNGESYRLELAVFDKAGNSSAIYRLPQSFLLDTTAPEAELSLNGLYVGGSSLYLTNLADLEATLTIREDESGASGSFNLIDSAAGTAVTGWDSWEKVQQTVLIPGGKYLVAARVINGVGLETEVLSETFTFDNTAPFISNLTGPDLPITAGESFILNLSADDDETEIVKYRIAIGREPGATEFTALMPGNQKGWYELKTNHRRPQLRLETPEGASGTYYITLEAINAAGLSARFGEERTLTVSDNPERIVASDQGPYTMFADKLSGWWRYNGTRTVIGYRFRILDQNNHVVRDWENTAAEMVTVSGLRLQDGQTYRFEVRAFFNDGISSEPGFSSGVTVDTTAPEISELKTPLYTTPNNFGFEWAGLDDGSGISRVLAAIGTDYHQTDVTKGWVEVSGNSVTLSRDAAGEPLVFDLNTTNRYYLTLRLVNGAGLTAEKAAAAIVVDATPPPTPVVYDQGGFINTAPEQPLEAHWFWSAPDPESGCDYQWTILRYGEKVNPSTEWHDGDVSKRIALTMDEFPREHGETYTIAVKATNGAGLSSIGYSDGIMVDATAPYLMKVVVLDAINQSGDAEINYVTDGNHALRLWIDSYDPDSDIAQYRYAWNILEEVDNTERLISTVEPIAIENPGLVEGAVTIFLGEAVNQADITSPPGYSTGIVVDSGAPVIKNVRAGISGASLLFDWEADTSVSPVIRYEYAFIREAEMNSITENDWRTAEDQSLHRRLSLDAAVYPDGRYCLVVRGYNAAGTYSRNDAEHREWGISNIITLDRTAPQITTAVFPKYGDELLKFSVSAMDEGSGIGGYQYALGTAADQFQFSGGWVDLNTQASTVNLEISTGSGLVPHNVGVYLMVRVRDQVGLWSTPKVSERIVIDHTRPKTPTLRYGDFATNRLLLTGIAYHAADPESGLVNYRLGLVTEKGGAWIVTQEGQAQLTPEGQLAELNLAVAEPGLTEAGVYYLALQVQNGAGAWSEVGYSGLITVDTVQPALEFSNYGETLVINEPPLRVEYSLTEDAQVKITVRGADGAATEETISGMKGINHYTFKEMKPQIYIVTATATDEAGNVSEATEKTRQTVRVNMPPVVVLPGELRATIGRSLTLKAEVSDMDGSEGDSFTYEWLPGDGGAVLSGATPEYTYSALGQYTLTLTVTDKDGGKTTVTSVVKAGNTAEGELGMDETWSGIHRIYGDVVIPAGLKLTIQPGTEIIIDGVPGETGFNHALIVKGRLKVGAGTSFTSATGTAGGWKGILAEGEAVLEGVAVRHAARGVAALKGSGVTLKSCSFENNLAGVHAYGSKPVIRSSAFRNNGYGIKEDEGGRPVVKDCRFDGNGVDYYHLELTEISMAQLNGMPGNEGNEKEE